MTDTTNTTPPRVHINDAEDTNIHVHGEAEVIISHPRRCHVTINAATASRTP
jgi:hypothetical protein